MENLPEDVIFHVVLEYLNVLELIDLSLMETNPTFKKLIFKKVEEHPDNYYQAVWQGPKTHLFGYGTFILPENYKICYFQEANLIGAYLIGVNLIGVNLIGVNLEGANLEGANLEGANLICSNLEGANLTGANLKGANLACVNLLCANLGGANLIGATLKCANLYRANLKHTKTNDPEFHNQYPKTILVE